MKPVKLSDRRQPAEDQRRGGSAPGSEVDDPPARGFVFAPGRDPGANDVGVERTGEAAIPGDEQQADRPHLGVLLEDRHPPDGA